MIDDMSDKHRYCVILCGGVGSRFWPYSRANMPKQFIDFLGTGRSLLQMTYDRILPIVSKENIIVVTHEAYAPLVKQQLPDVDEDNILLEPVRRNTAPCIAWAAWHIAARDPEASMIVTPSDHLITREREYEKCVVRGFEFVESRDALLTLGVMPVRPDTNYGYIQIGEQVENDINKVKTFTEKPNIDLARVFIESGEFYWNSGIFLWSIKSICKAFHDFAPEIAAKFDDDRELFGTAREREMIAVHFPACASISIDFAVMEKAGNVYVETANFGWNDLGTWSALYDMSPKNRDANVTQNCSVFAYNSRGNIFAVRGDKIVVVDGLNDYIVSDSGDVLLICPKSEEQRIKQMVNDTKVNFGDKYL